MKFISQAFYADVDDPLNCQWDGPDCCRVAFNRIALDGTRELGFCVKYIYNRDDAKRHWFGGATIMKNAIYLDGAQESISFLEEVDKDAELSLAVSPS